MNARERLEHAAEWFGWQEEQLSFGLKNAFDALRLYDYAQEHPALPEMADEWTPEQRIEAIGYDPLRDYALTYEATTSGADQVVAAMLDVRRLIDSVAWVAKEGDKEKPLAALDAVLNTRL